MDIFDLASEGIKMQSDEIKEKEAEQAQLKAQKSYKIDIKEALLAASNKDYDWFNRLGENQKQFQPFMLNMWMAMIWDRSSKQKKLSHNDLIYTEILKEVNFTLNKQLFNVSKEMYWLLACTVQDFDAPFVVDFKKSIKKTAGEKYNPKVIKYMAQDLYTSTDKILDMVDNGLITSADMKSIEKDLDTLEDQSKKRKK